MAADREAQKRAAATAALPFVREGRVIGIGTGSTANAFIDLLGPLRHKIPGAVASSEATAARLRAAGIPVVDLNDVESLDVYVDGADEISPQLHMIKGGGGALTREKLVAELAKTFVCVADSSKLVERLGAFPIALEVIPMARRLVQTRVRAMGGEARLREGFVTDNGQAILDARGFSVLEPTALESALEAIPGVICCGLFARRPADVALIAGPDGVRRLER